MASARRWCSVKSSATCSCPCGCCSRQSSKSKGDIRLSATCNLPTCAWCAAHSVNHEVQLRDAKHPVMHRGRLADAQAFHLRQLRTYTAVVAISLQNPFAETTKVRRVLPRQQVARPAKPCAMVCAFSQRQCIAPWTGFLTFLASWYRTTSGTATQVFFVTGRAQCGTLSISNFQVLLLCREHALNAKLLRRDVLR